MSPSNIHRGQGLRGAAIILSYNCNVEPWQYLCGCTNYYLIKLWQYHPMLRIGIRLFD